MGICKLFCTTTWLKKLILVLHIVGSIHSCPSLCSCSV